MEVDQSDQKEKETIQHGKKKPPLSDFFDYAPTGSMAGGVVCLNRIRLFRPALARPLR